ncbi:MSMEG_1061 family FMN-dependent PPOX-type flavoprotein [Isoptericola croceus]|uniref:MSMEG_1061 family FMN-dependent PPOX-type flavoprotein n=1 Tax=Isoptericola croceus TaxID=3031406 RepID=UPI0023F75D91|nr:MSMEG_1061 family FMN-dependent PPOX-type flavoprotein [Isoptericola croceus]
MSSHGGTPVKTVAELEEHVGIPLPRVRDKVDDRLREDHRRWIAESPLCFLATADADGRADVSPKGDPAGFVHVLDDATIAVPDRPGNRRVDGFRNVLTNPEVALVFVVPGRGDTLRVNGTARLLRDVPYAEQMQVKGHVPSLVLEVSVREVFMHCAKAFLRSRTWDPGSWAPDAVPRRAVLAHRLESTDVPLATLDEHYGPAYAERLYG